MFALGVCRFPEGPVGLSPEPPDERGVVDPDRFGVVDPDRFPAERSDADRFCAADARCDAAVDRFAPVPAPDPYPRASLFCALDMVEPEFFSRF